MMVFVSGNFSYFRQEGYILFGICLSVYMLATLRKRTTDWVFMKILPEMYFGHTCRRM